MLSTGAKYTKGMDTAAGKGVKASRPAAATAVWNGTACTECGAKTWQACCCDDYDKSP